MDERRNLAVCHRAREHPEAAVRVDPPDALLAQVFSGLATGGIYASVALALVMIYQATHLVNFAQGELAMFCTYLAWTMIDAGFPYWAAFAALIDPLPQAQCRMPDGLRAFYVLSDDGVRSAMDPALMGHRDFIYERYLEMPLRL